MFARPYNYPVRVEPCKCGCGREVIMRTPNHTGYHKTCLCRMAKELHREKGITRCGPNPGGGCAACSKLAECRAILGVMRLYRGHLQVRSLLCQKTEWTNLVQVGG